jgi:hypothetical protein
LSFEAYFQKSMPKKADAANRADIRADIVTANHRSPLCVARLIQIIMGNDEFYRRLLDESQDSPNREEMDDRRLGAKTHFWSDVKRAFVDNNFHIDWGYSGEPYDF